jgi:phage/plasmid-like protein (TIGR03299 family)
MGEIIEAVLDADGNVKFETAGSVRDGRQVWALAYLDEPYEVPGDTTQVFPFLALLNAHDGSAACKLTYTDVRVVCWNTWNAASEQGERTGQQFTFRHTGNVAERIDEAKKALAGLREESKATRAMFEALAQQPVNEQEIQSFVELFLPSPRDVGELCTDRVHQNVTTARNTFTRLYESSLTTEGIRGSAFGLLQTSTEYLDHVRGYRSKDTLMGRTLLRPEPLKAHALDLIEDVVGADWRARAGDMVRPARPRAKQLQTTS